jgi:Flp pilus assembly protein TadB
VYQDKEVSVKKQNKQRVRSSSYGREELKISEDGKERTDDEDDDEEHSTASYDSSDGESSQRQLQLYLLAVLCLFYTLFMDVLVSFIATILSLHSFYVMIRI